MHRLLPIVLPFMFALTLIGCEQVVDVELPYEKRIVVNGFIGRDIDTVLWLSRTLPATVEATHQDAALRGATVSIDVDGQVFTCPELDTLAGGYALPRLAAWAGKTVTLRVRGDGMEAMAVTRVPEMPEVVATRARRANDDIQLPVEWAMYVVEMVMRLRQTGVVWGEDVSSSYRGWNGDAVVPFQFWSSAHIQRTMPSNGFVEQAIVLYAIQLDSDRWGALPDSLSVRGLVADPEYARYLDRPRGGSNDGFGFGGVNPYSNVTGQGIGLFVGVAQTPAVRMPLERVE